MTDSRTRQVIILLIAVCVLLSGFSILTPLVVADDSKMMSDGSTNHLEATNELDTNSNAISPTDNEKLAADLRQTSSDVDLVMSVGGYPSEVTPTETFTVPVTIENQGGEKSEEINLGIDTIDGLSVEQWGGSVGPLDPGEEASAEWVFRLDSDQGGSADTVAVSGDSPYPSAQIEVDADGEEPEEPFFLVDPVDSNIILEEGEEFDVAVKVENTGSQSDTQTVDIDTGGLGTATKEVSLDAGDSTTITRSFSTSTGDAGEYTGDVESADDSTSMFVAVESDNLGRQPEISRNQPTSTNIVVNEGETQNFEVETSDPDEDLQAVEWYVDGTLESSENLETGPSQTHDWERSFDDVGEYTIEAVVIDSEGNTDSLTWTLRVDPSDSAEGGLVVEVVNQNDDGISTADVTVFTESQQSVGTDSSGAAEFTGLEEDTYIVAVEVGDQRETELVEISEGQTTHKVVFDTRTHLTGQVVTDEGDPVYDVTVQVAGRETATNELGEFVFSEPLQDGEHVVEVQAAGQSVAEETVDLGGGSNYITIETPSEDEAISDALGEFMKSYAENRRDTIGGGIYGQYGTENPHSPLLLGSDTESIHYYVGWLGFSVVPVLDAPAATRDCVITSGDPLLDGIDCGGATVSVAASAGAFTGVATGPSIVADTAQSIGDVAVITARYVRHAPDRIPEVARVLSDVFPKQVMDRVYDRMADFGIISSAPASELKNLERLQSDGFSKSQAERVVNNADDVSRSSSASVEDARHLVDEQSFDPEQVARLADDGVRFDDVNRLANNGASPDVIIRLSESGTALSTVRVGSEVTVEDINRISRQGTLEDVRFVVSDSEVARMSDSGAGTVWLEKGHESGGLEYLLHHGGSDGTGHKDHLISAFRHIDNEEDIVDAIYEAVRRGQLSQAKDARGGYTYTHRIANSDKDMYVFVGENGYIVDAYPRS